MQRERLGKTKRRDRMNKIFICWLMTTIARLGPSQEPGTPF